MKLLEKFSFRKMLLNKKIAIILSIFMAFFFWLIISVEETPERERVINKVQINVNTDDIFGNTNLKVVGDIAQTASVKVFGPNYLVSALTPDDIIVEADLSKVNGANEYELSLFAQKKSGSSGFTIMSLSPETITVNLDYYETKSIEASAVIDGYGRVDDDDYIYDAIFTANNSPNFKIDVSGFRNDLNKLSSIEVRASTDEIVTETKVFGNSEIFLLDSRGNKLDSDNYQLSVETAPLALTVSKEKTIAVTPSYAEIWNRSILNTLANSWTTSTKTLTLKGPPETIDSITKLEYVNPIDITQLSASDGSKTFELTPRLPDGVSISDATHTVSFTYNMSRFANKVFNIASFEHEGTLTEGIKVTYDKKYNVTVCGTKSVIASLSAKDLYLFVDLSDLKVNDSGTKTVRGVLKSRSNDAVWMVGSCDVAVKIQ